MNNIFLFLYSIGCIGTYITTDNLYRDHKIVYSEEVYQTIDRVTANVFLTKKKYVINIWFTFDGHPIRDIQIFFHSGMKIHTPPHTTINE